MPAAPAAPLRNASSVTVTVVVTSHNYGRFLSECIASIAAQTFRDWELIVVDDGSTDDTVDVARRAMALCADRPVTVLTTRQGGVSRARNLGISMARGTYVSCLDADDLYCPSALERMVAEFEKDPALGVVSSPVDGDENSGGMWGHRPFSFAKLREACLISSCAMFRREAWSAAGGYDETMPGYEDWDFWVTIGAAGYPMKCLDEIVWQYRLRQDGKYYTKSRPRDLELRARIVRNHPDVYEDCCRELAGAVAAGEVTDAEILACPHPVFASSFRAEAAIGRATDPAHEDDGSGPVLMAQPCLVPFEHRSSRAGRLGWAQRVQWELIERYRSEGRAEPENLSLSAGVPPGTTVSDFLTAVARLVGRHESLRTRFAGADGDAVRQRAIGTGYVDVARYHVRAGHAASDEMLRHRVGAEPFDLERRAPFRAGFVDRDGEVTHAAFAVSRLIVDAGGCELLLSWFQAELAALDKDETGSVYNVHGHVVAGVRSEDAAPEAVHQQLDQVEWEASPDGVRAETRALEHWRKQMAAVRALPRPAILDDGTIHSVLAPAGSMLTAADAVARGTAASSSGVVLAAFLEAAAQTLSLDGLGCFLHCSNRADGERRRSIARLKNLTPFTCSPGGSDFGAVVRRVFRDSLEAYRHAQSPGELLLPRLGLTLDDAPFVYFNDVRSVTVMESESAGPDDAGGPGAGPGTEPDGDKPVLIGTSPGNTRPSSAVLSLSVGAYVGTSRRPFLHLETNLLSLDGIGELVDRMHEVLATAAVR